ncbi:HlyD family secretion protein [Sporomusa aerivorans]|uniref:HlyD family secretion protein n=1 Tax=Sporomusa aerivorans TaxID=204936 RepID=UPI00352A393E
MNLRQKSLRVGIVFLGLLLIGGMLLVFTGRDVVTLALEKKEGILTAEQVKIAFENIGGRLVNEAVKESQEVKKGDILMALDSTDIDLAIERLQTQINQMEAQISQLSGSIEIGLAKASTSEIQTYRQIEQQKMALDAAKATYDNQLLTYNRKKTLTASGAVSQSELDSAQMALDVASANVGQQQRLLEKMLAGSGEVAREQVLTSGNASNIYLPDIDHQRQDLENNKFGVQSLQQQKQNLSVQLKELYVKKERLTLRASEDGKILKIIAKQGEMVSLNAPVILLESKRYYYDIYLDEQQASRLKRGDEINGSSIAGHQSVKGIIRFITAAPGFADLKMSREKGQADLAAFQVRIYVEPQENLLPGMTIGVNQDAFLKR